MHPNQSIESRLSAYWWIRMALYICIGLVCENVYLYCNQMQSKLSSLFTKHSAKHIQSEICRQSFTPRAASNAITHAYASFHCSFYVCVAIIIRPVKRWSWGMNIRHTRHPARDPRPQACCNTTRSVLDVTFMMLQY